jgi:hypothetical protein
MHRLASSSGCFKLNTVHCKKCSRFSRLPTPVTNHAYSPWLGIHALIKLFPDRESLISDIPAGDKIVDNFFNSVVIWMFDKFLTLYPSRNKLSRMNESLRIWLTRGTSKLIQNYHTPLHGGLLKMIPRYRYKDPNNKVPNHKSPNNKVPNKKVPK